MSKFLYKIYSGYDRFTPARIPERLDENNRLALGWRQYIDEVEKNDLVSVYFHGPGRFENGVYLEGIVQAVNVPDLSVEIRIRRRNTQHPLTDREESKRIAKAVKQHGRQVFLYPQEWVDDDVCNIDTSAKSCQDGLCISCKTWRELPLISDGDFSNPAKLSAAFSDFVPAYWVIPKQGNLRKHTGASIRMMSEFFYRFKFGQANLAYPLALGIHASLEARDLLGFDCIIPIPLSPGKAKLGEINRVRLLADELEILTGVPVLNALSLTRSVSKRAMLRNNYTTAQFRDEYFDALVVKEDLSDYDQILIVDDVCTGGTTLSCAAWRIRQSHPECELLAATAGQMIVKAVVHDTSVLGI